MRPSKIPAFARRLGAYFFATALTLASAWGNAYAADQHALWAVHGKHNTVYLLGSVHLLSPDEAFPAEMDAAYKKAKALIMEIDMDDLDPLKAQTATLQLGLLPDNTTLQKEIGPDASEKLSNYAQRLGLDPAMFARFRPWLAAITLSQLQLMKMGLSPQAGVEQRFTTKAVTDKKEIRGLETLEEQLGLFASLSKEQETKYLLYTIEEAERTEEEFSRLLTAWRQGDAKALEQTLTEGFHDFPELFNRLTIDRNRRWVAPIETLLKDDSDYLVVVGAFHLVGKDGLIDLLEHRGFKVTQH